MKHLVAIIVVLAAILSGQAQTGPEASIERPGSRWGPFSLARPAAMSSFTTDRRILVSRFKSGGAAASKGERSVNQRWGGALTRGNKKRTLLQFRVEAKGEPAVPTVTPDKRSAWLQKLDQECPYQITLPRRQLTDDSAIMDFLLSSHVGKFDMYVEDECAAYVRYCFADPMDAAIFRSRFEPKSEPFRQAG